MSEPMRFGLILIIFLTITVIAGYISTELFGDYFNEQICSKNYPVGSILYVKCNWRP